MKKLPAAISKRQIRDFGRDNSNKLRRQKNVLKWLGMITTIFAVFLCLTGFNIDNAIVPRNEILSGGPPKDGIPAILNPGFLKADEAAFLNDEDQIIGVKIGERAKAYPIKILNWHEVVNDSIDGVSIAVTF
jgi:hypothetical protein